ncbi:trehalose-phosphatase [Noviherbaspirillum galbum]|uniref:Trehalose 6-phosphate phosphatase n=1 Tax=Noviherbaspirillum galbum TaxID=2709383 RepID=A0A6B3SVA0_9BURK|nr:trehalose-phosphatase [Noviherbaspirillum galbum]NEX62302.1 trehalose-phosphatase [Noviherbaspirillum galbum]
MIDLLHTPEASRRLESIIRPGLLCAFDFDGTLAPIVPQPHLAVLPAELRALLVQVSAHAPVAIITGRSIDDIHHRLGFDPDFIVGNHGLEGVPGWENTAAQHAETCQRWKAELEAAFADMGADPGIVIEDKRFSLSVHYRQAANPGAAEQALDRLFTRLHPIPRIVWGKMVFNLMPDNAGHKGTALAQLMKVTGASNAIYVGDDITDEDVFRLRRPDVLSVRIEHSTESAAECYLDKPEDMAQLLGVLIERMRAAGAANWVQAPAPITAA